MVRRQFYPGWDPWRDLANFQRDVNRFLGGSGNPNPAKAVNEGPAVNIWRGESGVALTAEIPGLDPHDLDITVNGDTVTLRGNRPEEAEGDQKFHRRERTTGRFVRTLQLPFRVDPNQTEARYERGVLTVILPQVEEEKPKKITVKTV